MRNKEHTSDKLEPQLTDEELQQATGGIGSTRKSCFQHIGKEVCEEYGCRWDVGKHGYECLKKNDP